MTFQLKYMYIICVFIDCLFDISFTPDAHEIKKMLSLTFASTIYFELRLCS